MFACQLLLFFDTLGIYDPEGFENIIIIIIIIIKYDKFSVL